MILELI